jgi:PAS domain-containing protein
MFSNLFNEAPVPILCTDGNGFIVYSNAAMNIMVQKEQETLLGQHISEFATEDSKEAINHVLHDPELNPKLELRLHVQTGIPLTVRASISINKEECIWFFENRSEYNEFIIEQKRFQTLPKEYGHNINNLLTVILSATQLIEMDLEDNSPFLEDLQDITEASNRAATQTRLFMNMGRLEHIDQKVIELDRFIKEKRGLFGQLLGSSQNITWEKNCTIYGNPHSFQIAIAMSIIHLKDISPQRVWALSMQSVSITSPFSTQTVGVVSGNYACVSIYDREFPAFDKIQYTEMYTEHDEAPLLAPVWDSVTKLKGSIVQRKTQRQHRSISLFIPLSIKEESL